MRIVIAGAHGKIARSLTRELSGDGHTVIGLIRIAGAERRSAAGRRRARGPRPGEQFGRRGAQVLAGADAAVFAAGAGAGSGDARKSSVDLGASVLLADAAEAAGVRRFVQISSTGADLVRGGATPDGVPADFVAYLQAKLGAEEDLVRARPRLDHRAGRARSPTTTPPARVRLERTGPGRERGGAPGEPGQHPPRRRGRGPGRTPPHRSGRARRSCTSFPGRRRWPKRSPYFRLTSGSVERLPLERGRFCAANITNRFQTRFVKSALLTLPRGGVLWWASHVRALSQLFFGGAPHHQHHTHTRE